MLGRSAGASKWVGGSLPLPFMARYALERQGILANPSTVKVLPGPLGILWGLDEYFESFVGD